MPLMKKKIIIINQKHYCYFRKINKWIANVIAFVALQRKIISCEEQQWNLYGEFNLEEGQSQQCK